jgi:drug/metabolite transporter (DMT)-like permease
MLVFSIVFVVFSVVINLLFEASDPMMMVSFAACLFSILPIISILSIRRKKVDADLMFHNSEEERVEKFRGYNNRVRGPALIFGLLMLLFTIGSALTAYEIYEPDIPGGVILAFSGFLALGGGVFYQREIPSDMPFSYLPPPPLPSTHTKEIIREKEVIVKVRCQYCGNTFDETLDQCTTCGAKK